MSEKLLVPDIGDFEKVEVIEILVKDVMKLRLMIQLLQLKVTNPALKYLQLFLAK